MEYVRGIQVVKIFNADARSFKAMYEAIQDYARLALNYSMSCKIPWVLLQWAMFCVAALIVPFIFLLPGVFSQGTETAVELLMLMFLSGVMFSTIMKVMYVVMYAFNGGMAVDKLEAMYEDMHKDALWHGSREMADNFDIEFDHVTFGYGEKPVLKDVSFTLKQNHSYALVVENEKKIQDSLNHLIAGKTVIIISHRLKSVEHVNRIVVVDDGIVEASGTHEELMKISSTYQKLVGNAALTEEFMYYNVAAGGGISLPPFLFAYILSGFYQAFCGRSQHNSWRCQNPLKVRSL